MVKCKCDNSACRPACKNANISLLCGLAQQTPDLITINRFRSERMKEIIGSLFSSMLQLLIEKGYVKLDHYFLDGTKIEAKQRCTKAKGNRKISVSFALQAYKQKTRENLCSKQGRELSVRRMVEVESVFDQFKGNRSFRRFHLRGLPKVNIEVGLVSLAHNLLKKALLAGNKTNQKSRKTGSSNFLH